MWKWKTKSRVTFQLKKKNTHLNIKNEHPCLCVHENSHMHTHMHTRTSVHTYNHTRAQTHTQWDETTSLVPHGCPRTRCWKVHSISGHLCSHVLFVYHVHGVLQFVGSELFGHLFWLARVCMLNCERLPAGANMRNETHIHGPCHTHEWVVSYIVCVGVELVCACSACMITAYVFKKILTSTIRRMH